MDASARTWRVARDGSGDFIIVAEAVDAAASGDTISIAPGLYPETPVRELDAGPFELSARVTQGELTIIGDDRDLVVVGPAVPSDDLERGPLGIVVLPDCNLRISGVTVQNSSRGVDTNGEWVDVRDCKFIQCWQGVRCVLSGIAYVRDSYFESIEDAGVMVFNARGGDGALVERCEFVRNGLGIDFQPLNCYVRDSSFDGQGWGSVGVQVSFGGAGHVDCCTFTSHDNYGVVGTSGAQVFINDCVFEPDMQVNLSVEGLLVGTRNHLGGGTFATLMFNKLSTIDFHGNHILNAGGYSVRAYSGPEPVKYFDLSNNYWGTTDSAQMDEWIYDRNDRDTYWAIVDYLPMADQPIPTEDSSMGRLKSSFRDH